MFEGGRGLWNTSRGGTGWFGSMTQVGLGEVARVGLTGTRGRASI